MKQLSKIHEHVIAMGKLAQRMMNEEVKKNSNKNNINYGKNN